MAALFRRTLFLRGGNAIRAAIVSVVVVGAIAAAGYFVIKPETPVGDGTPQPAKTGLFSTWPKEDPQLALVLTGQTYGYLSPCGCSRPQRGGLERRFNFISSLKNERKWTTVALDLGDAAPAKGIRKQNLLKFKYTMLALSEMGYAALGLGEYDFAMDLFELLSQFTLNNPGKPPIILGANVEGVQTGKDGKPNGTFPRKEFFSAGPKSRPMVEEFEIVRTPGKPTIAVVSVVGLDNHAKVKSHDKQFNFRDNGETIKEALAGITKEVKEGEPVVHILLYGGPQSTAIEAAKAFPQFRIIICQSQDSEPPQFPVQANDGRTWILELGHKGQSVGVVGLFPSADKKDFDLHYQLVSMGEEYLTPPGEEAAKKNKALQLMEAYAQEVKDKDLLADYMKTRKPHAAQILLPKENLHYVGSKTCAKCHMQEYAVWSGTKHAHATEALEKATRPSNRQFDAECLICHTTGMEFTTGFTNAKDTEHLLHNGCENCHGPGSGHSEKPNDKELRVQLLRWRATEKDKLPSIEFMNKMAAIKDIAERDKVQYPEKHLVGSVSGMCRSCHDLDNDPKFEFFEYYPKIVHSGLKKKEAGLPKGIK